MYRAFLVLAAATAAFASDLTVSLQAVEASVQSVNDIIITAIVTNPTAEDLRVLAVNNVLDSSATQSFDITTTDGAEQVPFAGIKATFDLTQDSLYVTIPAGQSYAVNHTDLASYYDFSAFAPGRSFSFSARTDTFQSSGTVAGKISVTDDLSFTSPFTSLGDVTAEVSNPVCSDAGRKQVITDSLRYARSLAGGAATDINSHPNGPEYTTYFGGNTQSDIWYNFDRVAGDLTSDRDIYCSIDYSDSSSYCNGNPGVIAYTVLYSDGRTPIYVCELFFQAGTTPSVCQNGYDSTMSSRGGIILHELSHAVFGADDVIYGCSAAAGLSAADKRRNADNYRCMGLNIYLDYNCVNGPL